VNGASIHTISREGDVGNVRDHYSQPAAPITKNLVTAADAGYHVCARRVVA